MKPVVNKWQLFVSFADLDVKEIDLYDDAWGFSMICPAVITALSVIEISPRDALIEDLLCKIEHSGR
jgi:hypothetical protein